MCFDLGVMAKSLLHELNPSVKLTCMFSKLRSGAVIIFMITHYTVTCSCASVHSQEQHTVTCTSTRLTVLS